MEDSGLFWLFFLLLVLLWFLSIHPLCSSSSRFTTRSTITWHIITFLAFVCTRQLIICLFAFFLAFFKTYVLFNFWLLEGKCWTAIGVIEWSFWGIWIWKISMSRTLFSFFLWFRPTLKNLLLFGLYLK